ncbi:MAG: hypothetical protein ACR2GW_12575 [Pyrinomonadaceae bacterium]|nr:nuclear transport factor 2 family protein [Acidobacteriota bacterium]
MDERERSIEENYSNQTGYEAAPERPASPAFDEESIHRAQPAVPLSEVPARRATWPLSTVLLLLIAGVAGGAIALFVVTQYLRRSVNTSPPAATTAPINDPSQTNATPANEQTRRDGQSSATIEPAKADNRLNNPEAREDKRDGAQIDQNVAQENSGESEAERVAGEEPAHGDEANEADPRRSLRSAFDSWIASTNARDIDRQMELYGRRVNAFYLTRNASRRDVRAEKAQLFGRAETVEVRAGEPKIKFGVDNKTATMHFRKDYVIAGGGQNRRGAVLQELRWRLTGNGWKIISERDLRVLR